MCLHVGCLILTGSLKTFGRMEGTRMEFTPPSFTLIWDKMMICHEFCPSGVFTFRHRLERVWGEVLFTFFAWGRNWVLKLSRKSSDTSVVVKIKWKKTWTHCVAIPRTVSPTLLTCTREFGLLWNLRWWLYECGVSAVDTIFSLLTPWKTLTM